MIKEIKTMKIKKKIIKKNKKNHQSSGDMNFGLVVSKYFFLF